MVSHSAVYLRTSFRVVYVRESWASHVVDPWASCSVVVVAEAIAVHVHSVPYVVVRCNGDVPGRWRWHWGDIVVQVVLVLVMGTDLDIDKHLEIVDVLEYVYVPRQGLEAWDQR